MPSISRVYTRVCELRCAAQQNFVPTTEMGPWSQGSRPSPLARACPNDPPACPAYPRGDLRVLSVRHHDEDLSDPAFAVSQTAPSLDLLIRPLGQITHGRINCAGRPFCVRIREARVATTAPTNDPPTGPAWGWGQAGQADFVSAIGFLQSLGALVSAPSMDDLAARFRAGRVRNFIPEHSESYTVSPSAAN